MACVTVPAATAEMELAFSVLPGFRFHPTDQELICFFLRRKVLGHGGGFIPEVDLYRLEPHQLPGKSFSPSAGDPGAKVEWYFFTPRGRKYPTGLRMERATPKGFWKSTGKDRPVMHNGAVVGMKKTLVFHIGRAPGGMRTDWVMHEYRLHGDRNHHIQDNYALCRVFKKNMVAPSTDVSGGADADEDPRQFVPRGVDMAKDPIQVESECNVPDANNDLMQSMLGDVATDSYPIIIESDSKSDGSDANNDLMYFMLSDVGTDKDPIHVQSKPVHAVTHNGGMQFLIGGGDMDKVGVQFFTGGDVTEKGSTSYVAGSTCMDWEGMQPVTVDTEKDQVKSVPSGANAGNVISWMEFLRGDVYWNQFIPDDGWNSSADVTH